MMTTQSQHISFVSAARDATSLEGILTVPDQTGLAPCALLSHSAPPAGTMDEALLLAIESELLSLGYATLRFNFRGIGNSAGEPTNGVVEPLDLAGAITCALAHAGTRSDRVLSVGHGLGAVVSLTQAHYDPRVAAVAAISPPLYRLEEDVPRLTCPALLLTGDLDEVCPVDQLTRLSAELCAAAQVATVPRATHLMPGREREAAALVASFAELCLAAHFS